MAPSDQESLSVQVTGDSGSIPGLGRAPGEGNGNLLQNSGKSHRQRNLVGYSPWGHKESDTTKHTLLVVNLRKVMLFFFITKTHWNELIQLSQNLLGVFYFHKNHTTKIYEVQRAQAGKAKPETKTYSSH